MPDQPKAPYRVCVVYQMDPRGLKVGGIETHVRTLLERHPPDVECMLVGVDAIGDLALGERYQIEVGARRVTFLPVLRYSDDMARLAARLQGQNRPVGAGLCGGEHAVQIRVRGEDVFGRGHGLGAV